MSDKSFSHQEIFKRLNAIPRPSHHEKAVADFLCDYAKELHLEFERDKENCVVIRKPASKGCEKAPTVVLLNHMDMVAVGDGSRPFDPLRDGIQAYEQEGWLKALGTSLGADNGVGLSMALAVLADDDMPHPALEVLTTTNEEDGMSGAEHLGADFIKGRRVINLDSEDYDTITVGAAGALIQSALFAPKWEEIKDDCRFYRISILGGQGGHSGVDIHKGRCNAIKELAKALEELSEDIKSGDCHVTEISGGFASAAIPASCGVTIALRKDGNCKAEKISDVVKRLTSRLDSTYARTDPGVYVLWEEAPKGSRFLSCALDVLSAIGHLPSGVLSMREDLPGVVMTSNNIGLIQTEEEGVSISLHTRSFSDQIMEETARQLSKTLLGHHAQKVSLLMNTPAWQEKADSEYLRFVESTFKDVLGFTPRRVAMHFVLEAGYYVRKYPGIEIACIGPRILEPHSTSERVEISTIDNIWEVLKELLKRLSKGVL